MKTKAISERGQWSGKTFLGVGLGLALVWGAAGCHKTSAQSAGSVDPNGDPAAANMVGGYAPAGQPTAQVLGQQVQNESQQQAEEYSQQQPAPIERQAPPDSGYPAGDQGYANGAYDNGNGELTDAQAADIYASDLTDEQADNPPPPLPDYDQPPAPDPDYLWTPGYWSWGPGGYYWVPGCWVAAPYVGALWTPGYWGFYGGHYRFHHGFWGLHIGFYGGVDYGFGYFGTGYYGGYWNGGHFFYNTAVNRVNVNVIRNVYVHRETYRQPAVRVSFNGGRGGLQVRPRVAEVAVMHEQRIPPMASQVQVRQEASQNRQQFFNQNRGRPAMTVSARPVVKDRTLPAALPRAAGPAPVVPQQGFRGGAGRPGQPNNPAAGNPGAAGQPNAGGQVRGGFGNRPQEVARPGVTQPSAPVVRPGNEVRPAQPAQPQVRPAQPVQPGQPQVVQPGPGNRPEYRRGPGQGVTPQGAQPQYQARPGAPQTAAPAAPAQPGAPAQPNGGRPNFRRDTNPSPDLRPAQPSAPAQPQQPPARVAPQNERRVQPQAQAPRPQQPPPPQVHAAPAPPPAQPARPQGEGRPNNPPPQNEHPDHKDQRDDRR